MMQHRRKTTAIAALVLIGIAAFAWALSHDAGPARAAPLAPNAVPMRAVVHRRYGSTEVVRIETIARPTPAANQLLIQIHAAALNPLDWHYLHGTPYVLRLRSGLGRPRFVGLGVDFAGTVAAVGAQVRQFHVGEQIFGTADGSLAEYAVSTEVGLARKPSNITFAQAAAVPVAGLTALQGLRDQARVRPGQKVLINGASGGVGTFAVQLAKLFGADVTAVCSTRNVQLVRLLGADHIIDYTQSDFVRAGERYDVIFDTVGNVGLLTARHVLTPHGVFVVVGSQSTGPWLGGITRPIAALLISPFVSQRFVAFIADAKRTADLEVLRDLLQTGRLKPVIDRHYPLSETRAAISYLEAGHARGKVIVDLD